MRAVFSKRANDGIMEIPFPDVRRLCNECCIDVTMTCPVVAFLGPEQMKPKAKTATEAKAGKARQPTTNPSFLPGCKKAVVEAFNTCYPTMLLSTMIKRRNITLQDVPVGGKGECTSFGLLGRCSAPCPYNHMVCNPTAERQAAISAAIAKAMATIARGVAGS